jgi:hypothetical protein
MFSRHHLSSRQGTPAPAAGCHRGGAELTALAIPIDLGARRDAGPFLSTARGAYGDPDWEADVASLIRTAAARDRAGKIPREERNR